MNPFVIDRDKFKRYVFLAVALIIASFFSGYFTAQYLAGQKHPALDAEPQKKLESVKPDASSDNQTSDPVIPQQDESTTEISQSARSSLASTQTPSQSAPAVKKTVVQRPAPSVASQSVTSELLKYSIQAGMFGSLANANKFLDQLQTADFDAYMEEHQGTDGVIRYNVRFGHFASRDEAEQRLKIYQEGFTNPAYVIINP